MNVLSLHLRIGAVNFANETDAKWQLLRISGTARISSVPNVPRSLQCLAIQNLEPLSVLTNLRSLVLEDNWLQSIEPLSDLPNLASVNLCNVTIPRWRHAHALPISPLSVLGTTDPESPTRARKFIRSCLHFTSLEPLAHLSGLPKFFFNCNVRSRQPLTSLRSTCVPWLSGWRCYTVATVSNERWSRLHRCLICAPSTQADARYPQEYVRSA